MLIRGLLVDGLMNAINSLFHQQMLIIGYTECSFKPHDPVFHYSRLDNKLHIINQSRTPEFYRRQYHYFNRQITAIQLFSSQLI